MDYEKKYRDALERARNGKPMNEVFPELNENRDEKIRKAIVEHFKAHSKKENIVTYCGVATEDIIAYLENNIPNKSNPTAEDVLIKAGLKPFKDGNQWCILIGDNLQDGICGFGDTIDDALYNLLIDMITYQKEHKVKQNDIYYARIEGRNQVIEHPEIYGLQKIKEQDKQEDNLKKAFIGRLIEYYSDCNHFINEEDKMFINFSIDFLTTYREVHTTSQEIKDEITTCIEKLKSLEERFSFHPFN